MFPPKLLAILRLFFPFFINNKWQKRTPSLPRQYILCLCSRLTTPRSTYMASRPHSYPSHTPGQEGVNAYLNSNISSSSYSSSRFITPCSANNLLSPHLPPHTPRQVLANMHSNANISSSRLTNLCKANNLPSSHLFFLYTMTRGSSQHLIIHISSSSSFPPSPSFCPTSPCEASHPHTRSLHAPTIK